jgi:hypothetical protein
MPNRYGAYGARERQERYNELRAEGMESWLAAIELGLDVVATAGRYERWYQSGLTREDSQESHARRMEAARQAAATTGRKPDAS